MATVSAVVLALGLLATYLTWTASRLDRLHLRCDVARAALDAQLLRRAAVALELAAQRGDEALAATAHAAHVAPPEARAEAESALSEALRLVRDAPAEVTEAAGRVVLARHFLGEAVRDTRRFRRRRVVRLLRLSGSAAEPEYFDMDDAPPGGAGAPVAGAGPASPRSEAVTDPARPARETPSLGAPAP